MSDRRAILRGVVPYYIHGPAAVRGIRWAERVARALRDRPPASWPAWPPLEAPRVQAIAARLVSDLGQSEQDRAAAAAICHEGAGRRWEQLRADPLALKLLLNQRA